MYNFDTIIDRKGTESVKYDFPPYQTKAADSHALWIADMDFQTAPEVLSAMKNRIDHGIFGYFKFTDRYYDAVKNWHKKRFDVDDLQNEHIFYQHSVKAGISHALEILTNEGDNIAFLSPIYPGFTHVMEVMNRNTVAVLLKEDAGFFTVDFELFEKKIKENNVKVFIFCNPHNPTGRIWTKEEMEQLVEICLKYDVKIIADEIWADVVIDKNLKHLPLCKAVPKAKDITIALYSPSKGFNLAGLICSYSVCYNEELNDKLVTRSAFLSSNSPCVLAHEALIVSYLEGENWLDECCSYISDNMDFVIDFLQTRLPKIKCKKSQATYVLWLDFKDLGISHEELIEKAHTNAGFLANDGISFKEGGELHLRVNCATPRIKLGNALLALEKEFGNI